MDVSEEIDNIRENISKLNEKLLVEREKVCKTKKVSDKISYYEKQQINLYENIDIGKKKKLIAGEITREEFDGKNNMTEEELDKEMNEREKIEYNKDWCRLPKILKNKVIQTYVNELDHLSDAKKKNLLDELFKLLKNGKLVTSYVKYNKTEGKLECIKKLKIDEVKQTYELSIE